MTVTLGYVKPSVIFLKALSRVSREKLRDIARTGHLILLALYCTVFEDIPSPASRERRASANKLWFCFSCQYVCISTKFIHFSGFNESQLSLITDNKANRLFSISNFNGLDGNLAEDLCTKINDQTMLKRDESCLFPMNGTAECSKSVVQENGCSYLVHKCKMGCDSNSSGYEARPLEASYGRR
jgi:hypothetical protein